MPESPAAVEALPIEGQVEDYMAACRAKGLSPKTAKMAYGYRKGSWRLPSWFRTGNHSGRWLTYLEAIAVRVCDVRTTHGTANGFDWTGRDAALSEAGQERVEVVDK